MALVVAGLAIAGVYLVLGGLMGLLYGCVMSMDEACPAEAAAEAVPYLVIGSGLLAGAYLVNRISRR